MTNVDFYRLKEHTCELARANCNQFYKFYSYGNLSLNRSMCRLVKRDLECQHIITILTVFSPRVLVCHIKDNANIFFHTKKAPSI